MNPIHVLLVCARVLRVAPPCAKRAASALAPIPLLLFAWLSGACGDDKPSASECKAGEIGCACRSPSTCDTGLVCVEGQCFAEGSVGLSVLDERARGCEVLLEDQGAPVARASFSDSVQGRFVREAPRTAVAFIAAKDASISDGAVRIVFADDGAGAPRIVKASCTDTEGAVLKDAKVEINE